MRSQIGAQRRPFLVGEEPMLVRIDREPPVDDPARLLVPGRRVALVQHVVTGIAVRHRVAPRCSASAASPASARPVKLGGAGSGGPLRTFCVQLRQPPMLRETP